MAAVHQEDGFLPNSVTLTREAVKKECSSGNKARDFKTQMQLRGVGVTGRLRTGFWCTLLVIREPLWGFSFKQPQLALCPFIYVEVGGKARCWLPLPAELGGHSAPYEGNFLIAIR